MDRRTALKVLAATPVVISSSSEVRAEVPEVAKPAEWGDPPLPDTIEGFGNWQGMAALLWKNFDRYTRLMPEWWNDRELRFAYALCHRTCQSLLDPDREPFGSHVMSAGFFPEQDPELTRKVSFGVMDAPIGTFEGVTKPALARSLKLRAPLDMRKAMEDLTTYHGLDGEVELLTVCGQEIALEVLNEIRNDFKKGKKIKAYSIYLPPFLSAVDPKMLQGDWSVDRRWRMRYAKFYEGET